MPKIFLFLLLFLTVLSPSVVAQMCGNGTFTVELPETSEVEYRLFSLTPKGNLTPEQIAEWRLKTFFPGEKPTALYKALRGARIENKIAERFVKSYRPGNFAGMPNGKSAGHADGLSRHGFIQFPTSEVHMNLYLLKLSARNRPPMYFIANYFGGCRERLKVEFK